MRGYTDGLCTECLETRIRMQSEIDGLRQLLATHQKMNEDEKQRLRDENRALRQILALAEAKLGEDSQDHWEHA